MPKPRKWKRGRARNRRAGCKMCKPWKINSAKKKDLTTQAEKRLMLRETDA